MPKSLYQDRIAKLAPDHDPRHIEAFMRVQYGVLDHLSKERFEAEVHFCAVCLEEIGKEEGEKVARSYGL